jgi:glycosyltransferase involved in cell wall biosynthesis
VLIITNRLVIGGMAFELIPLVYYLQKYFDITVLYGEKESDEKEIFFFLQHYPGLTLKRIPFMHKSIHLFNEVKTYRFIYKEIIGKNYQIVHTHGSKAGFIGRLAAVRAGVPCIIHTYHGHLFHSYFNSFISKCLIHIERWVAGFTNKIIATSEHQKEELAKLYKIAPPEKICAIHLGVDVEVFCHDSELAEKSFREKYALYDNSVLIGIVARIVPVKNFELFVEVVYKLIRSVSTPLKFFIIGDGTMKKNVQQMLSDKKIKWCDAEHFNTDATVVFTSWIENVASVLNALDIVMLTSNNEGTALALVEAQLCGKPVVATNVGGVQDTFLDKETGYLVEPGDAEDFTAKLKILIENKALRESMGRKATAFATKYFSKKVEVEKIKQLYNNCNTNN